MLRFNSPHMQSYQKGTMPNSSVVPHGLYAQRACDRQESLIEILQVIGVESVVFLNGALIRC